MRGESVAGGRSWLLVSMSFLSLGCAFWRLVRPRAGHSSLPEYGAGFREAPPALRWKPGKQKRREALGARVGRALRGRDGGRRGPGTGTMESGYEGAKLSLTI